jgi:hypothetical protein
MQELSGVSEAARELAMSRFRLIQPHLEKNRPLQLVAADSKLLEQRWTVIASVIRMTGGNFRLLTRLLIQIERVLSVNNLHLVSNAVVEAARDSLVIGTS